MGSAGLFVSLSLVTHFQAGSLTPASHLRNEMKCSVVNLKLSKAQNFKHFQMSGSGLWL